MGLRKQRTTPAPSSRGRSTCRHECSPTTCITAAVTRLHLVPANSPPRTRPGGQDHRHLSVTTTEPRSRLARDPTTQAGSASARRPPTTGPPRLQRVPPCRTLRLPSPLRSPSTTTRRAKASSGPPTSTTTLTTTSLPLSSPKPAEDRDRASTARVISKFAAGVAPAAGPPPGSSPHSARSFAAFDRPPPDRTGPLLIARRPRQPQNATSPVTVRPDSRELTPQLASAADRQPRGRKSNKGRGEDPRGIARDARDRHLR